MKKRAVELCRGSALVKPDYVIYENMGAIGLITYTEKLRKQVLALSADLLDKLLIEQRKE